MKKQEYEVISHNLSRFRVFLVNLLYRTPHIHKDYEISLVLEGTITVTTSDGDLSLHTNDIFITNPFQSHEITADSPALILSVQIPPAFFSSYYPQIDNIEFEKLVFSTKEIPDVCLQLRNILFSVASSFFNKESFHEIKCAMLLNQLFYLLLQSGNHQTISEREKEASRQKGNRMRKIMHYIDAHYNEKLLLSDIAAMENLDLYYLSHFFKECFGLSFQNYLMKIRCEHARQLLLLTDYSLLDISMRCGFSDPKYFNKGFLDQYGCSPKEYRKSFQNARLEQQQSSMLSTQEFLSENASLVLLGKYQNSSFF